MKKMFLICNAHIDPVWQWDWEEGVSAALSTFRSVVTLSKEYDFIFAHNEACLYEWVERYDPELFAEIVALVKAGKWKIMGGWFLQPDCNMPSGESFIRQMKVGNEYFKEKFGAECTVALNFDSFGHSSALPQLLLKGGYKGYMMCRPMADYSDMPENFIWQGNDGSEIPAARVSGFYNHPMGKARYKVECELVRFKDEDAAVVLWGIGNHGGGPSRIDLSDLAALKKERTDIEFVEAVPEDYFAYLATQNLPKYDGQFSLLFPGCYTSVTEIKQTHCALETELYKTERLASYAHANLGRAYDYERFDTAQKDLLFCEFHDILPGTLIKRAVGKTMQRANRARYLLSEITAECMFSLSKQAQKPAPGDVCFAVFNPSPYARKESFCLDYMLPCPEDDCFVDTIVTMEGKEVTSQTVKEDSNIPLQWSKKVAVECELPAFGMAYLYAHPEKLSEKPTETVDYDKIPCGRYVVRFNREKGIIEGVYDGEELLCKGQRLSLYKDNYDPWGMQKYQHKRLTEFDCDFALAEGAACMEIAGCNEEVPNVRVVESGKIYTEIESIWQCGLGSAVVRYKFYKEHEYYDVDITVYNTYADRAVKWRMLPFDKELPAVCGNACGEERFPQDGTEHAFQRYIKIGDTAIVTKGVYGASMQERGVELTLLRTPAYAGHYIDEDHHVVKNDRAIDRIDRGERKFSLRVFPKIEAGKIGRRADEFLYTPVVLTANANNQASGEKRFPCLQGSEAVIMTAWKKSKDGREIFRFINTSENTAEAKLSYRGEEVTVAMNKYAIQTVVYDEKVSKLTCSSGLEI